MTEAALNYSTYLALDRVLNAQIPLSAGPDQHEPEHDEMLFIIIHQVYELWFKQLLHELDYAKKMLRQNDQPRTQHTLRRMLTILKTVVSQIDILETMTPLEFNSFRSYLESSSGFQSVQFRELEFALGYKRAAILDLFDSSVPQAKQLHIRFQEPTLWDAFLQFLSANGCEVPQQQLQRDVTAPISPSTDIQKILVDLYRNSPTLSQVCERLVDLDEGLQEWRYRHVKMVERTIGSKRGTGGSAGVDYLSKTIKPLFPDLWLVRTQL